MNLLLLSVPIALSGCVATTVDIDRLQQSMNSVQKSQADLVSKLDNIEQLMTAIREEQKENQKKVAILSQRMDDTQAKLGMRMDQISQLLANSTQTTTASAPTTIPGDLYKEAYSDYLAGKIDLAAKGFKSFIDEHPQSDLADDANFYLADCYLVKKDYAQSRAYFDKVLSTSIELRPQALLKRAYALEGLKQPENQKVTLQALVKEFPKSAEAQTAKEILENLPVKSFQSKKKKTTASNSKSHKRDLE